MIHAALDNPNTHIPPQNQVDKMAIGGIKSDGAAVEFARCFLRLANLPNFLLDRLSRFEATLCAGPAGSFTRSTHLIAANRRSEHAILGLRRST